MKRNLNASGHPVARAVVTTDGTGAIALSTDADTEFTSVAFTTDGSNGQFTVTIKAQQSANYAVVPSAASATAALAAAQLGTPTTTTFVVVVSDLAMPSVVDLAAVATRTNILLA